jgi:hypothetical protein
MRVSGCVAAPSIHSCGASQDFGALGFGHHFRLEAPTDIDAPLRALMREAYQVGTQEPRRGKPASNILGRRGDHPLSERR